MAYLYIFLSSACSILIAHLLKRARGSEVRTLHVLTVNYLVAALFVVVMKASKLSQLMALSYLVWAFIAGIGLIFIINFFVYSASVDQNGVGVSVAAMRLSLLLPVVVSLVYYNETLTSLKIVGIVTVFIALFALLPRQSGGTQRNRLLMLLLLLFLLSGLGDTSLKLFEEEISADLDETLFMGMVFLCSFLVGITALGWKGTLRFTKAELSQGALLGIPNLYSSVFLIWGLMEIDGAIAFPAVNVCNVLGGSLVGLWYWKDRVTRLQWAGLTLAIVAIILLIL